MADTDTDNTTEQNATDTNATDTHATDTPATDGGATSGDATALLRDRLRDTEARNAIAAAGGDVDLLLPHVRDAMRIEDDGNSVSIICMDGETAMPVGDYLTALRGRGSFAKAFTPDTSAGDAAQDENPAPVKGSGASEQGSPQIGSIDAGNPLAIGQALTDIATGKVSVSL